MTAMLPTASAVPDAIPALAAGRHRRSRRRAVRTAVLGALVAGVFATSLMIGTTFYGPDEVIRVLLGQQVPGASFTVGELRLPRAALGLLAGVAFGIAGVTFQTMLRNPLASPDIIGITWGASAAAVVAEAHDSEVAREGEHDRQQQEARDGERRGALPRGAVQASREPLHRGGHIPVGCARERPRHDALQHRRHADADEDQPRARETAAQGE